MAGILTTHVLDISRGRPAPDVNVELWLLDDQGERCRLLTRVQTNAEGRTDSPLLTGDALQSAWYELIFSVRHYFERERSAAPEPPFLDRVPVRFGLADPTSHYHVPLLITPWGYSTYRGQ